MLAVGLNQHIKKGTNCIRAVLFKWWDELQYTDVSFVAMVIIMITYSDNRQYDWLTIGDLVLDSTGPFICFSIRVFTTIRCVPRHILKKSGLQTLRWNWFVWCFLIYEILRFTQQLKQSTVAALWRRQGLSKWADSCIPDNAVAQTLIPTRLASWCLALFISCDWSKSIRKKIHIPAT